MEHKATLQGANKDLKNLKKESCVIGKDIAGWCTAPVAGPFFSR